MSVPLDRVDRGFTSALAIGLGLWLFLDILRVWLPSLITIFGQAAVTPPGLIGAFALGWFLSPLPVLLLRRIAARAGDAGSRAEREGWPLDVWFALLLGGVRLGVQATDGGAVQLYVASFGVFAGLTWLFTVVTRSRRSLLRGFALGIALATVAHAAFGTYAPVWRPGVSAWALAVAQVALFGWAVLKTHRTARSRAAERVADPVLCFLLLPALLLAGILTASPARAAAADGWLEGLAAVVVAVAAAAAFALSGGTATPGRHPAVPGALLVLSVGVAAFATTTADGVPGVLPFYAVIAQAVGALALIACLNWADWPGARGRPPRAGLASLATAGGGLLFVAVLFGYYAGYDLGYRADSALVAVALLIAVTAVLHGRRKGRDAGVRVRYPLEHRWPGVVLAASAAAVIAITMPLVTVPRPDAVRPDPGEGVRVLAYNLRMGYGMTGAFELRGVADTIRGANVDVVLLSEVDRGWLLNGGQDELGVLARSLDMEAVFAPAADQVWGDAVLTRLPVVEVVGHPLRAYTAPTGAQALSVVVEHGGGEIEFVSTHLQPPADTEPTLQAADLADLVIERTALGRPLVVGGDFNFVPNGAAWGEMERAGLYDALSAVRPRPTYPADNPTEAIDHIFVTADLASRQAAALPVVHSDHLPVLAQVVPR